ncbi:hypothetical protein HC891_09005 [Candidatus Gracilibacteria bacterium]|nr:hypothetical protein [Candidatus Gracilibacteria bacterium]
MPAPQTIYVIQSAHTDIGYTHPQEQIALMYLEHYDRVLELCQQTADAPEASRFKWTCETSWQVQHYLTHRPEREAEFLHYVRSGQIEITAAYLHFTDLIDPDAYRRSLAWVVAYCRAHKLPLRCAMHCDINGWPWSLADILAEYDIPYFCSQIHLDSATDPLGARGSVHYFWLLAQIAPFLPDTPVRVPQAFWWQGPKGGKVLHWLGEHYLQGNVLGISSPRGFAADKTRYFLETDRLSVDDLYAQAVQAVPRYLARLKADGYPYTIHMVSTGASLSTTRRQIRAGARGSRVGTPNTRVCSCAQPRSASGLMRGRSATLVPGPSTNGLARPLGARSGFAERPGSASPPYPAPPCRCARSCRAQRRPRAAAYLAIALEQERLALEHTWNAWSSSAQPNAPMNAYQGAVKAVTFHRAELFLDEAIGAALRALVPPSDETRLYSHATQAGLSSRTVHFSAGDMQLDPTAQQLVGADGVAVPFQREHPDLPEYITTLALSEVGIHALVVRAIPPMVASSTTSLPVLETNAWQIALDPQTGGLSRLYDKRTGREWNDPLSAYAFGQLIHEAVIHPLGREATHNTARFVALDIAQDELRARMGDTAVFAHTRLTFDHAPQQLGGPVFDELVVQGSAAAIGRVSAHWRLYHQLPLVELVLAWDKVWSDLPEAAYVVFPFAAAGGRLELETSGGFFQPGSHAVGGQLPGTCSTYYTIQRAARITAESDAQLLWLPIDAPLVMTNAVHYNRWETEPYRWNGLLASMPVNHYWHTNFATSQRGHIRLRYRFFSPHGLHTEEALQMAMPVEALGWR